MYALLPPVSKIFKETRLNLEFFLRPRVGQGTYLTIKCCSGKNGVPHSRSVPQGKKFLISLTGLGSLHHIACNWCRSVTFFHKSDSSSHGQIRVLGVVRYYCNKLMIIKFRKYIVQPQINDARLRARYEKVKSSFQIEI